VAEQQRPLRQRLRIVVVDGGQILEQIIRVRQRAAPARRLAVASLVVAAHRVAARVEPLRHPLVATAVLAQAVHDQHRVLRPAARPVAHEQRLAIGHAEELGAFAAVVARVVHIVHSTVKPHILQQAGCVLRLATDDRRQRHRS
jgi:hypothetical protein